MNIFQKSLIVFGSCLFATSALAGAQIVPTSDLAKSNAKVALDLVTDGDVTAFQFEIPLKEGEVPNLDGCVSDLPSTHTGACGYDAEGNFVKVLVFSTSNSTFTKGIVPVGSIGLNSSRQNIKVEAVEFVNSKGEKLIDHGTSNSSAGVGSNQTQLGSENNTVEK